MDNLGWGEGLAALGSGLVRGSQEAASTQFNRDLQNRQLAATQSWHNGANDARVQAAQLQAQGRQYSADEQLQGKLWASNNQLYGHLVQQFPNIANQPPAMQLEFAKGIDKQFGTNYSGLGGSNPPGMPQGPGVPAPAPPPVPPVGAFGGNSNGPGFGGGLSQPPALSQPRALPPLMPPPGGMPPGPNAPQVPAQPLGAAPPALPPGPLFNPDPVKASQKHLLDTRAKVLQDGDPAKNAALLGKIYQTVGTLPQGSQAPYVQGVNAGGRFSLPVPGMPLYPTTPSGQPAQGPPGQTPFYHPSPLDTATIAQRQGAARLSGVQAQAVPAKVALQQLTQQQQHDLNVRTLQLKAQGVDADTAYKQAMAEAALTRAGNSGGGGSGARNPGTPAQMALHARLMQRLTALTQPGKPDLYGKPSPGAVTLDSQGNPSGPATHEYNQLRSMIHAMENGPSPVNPAGGNYTIRRGSNVPAPPAGLGKLPPPGRTTSSAGRPVSSPGSLTPQTAHTMSTGALLSRLAQKYGHR